MDTNKKHPVIARYRKFQAVELRRVRWLLVNNKEALEYDEAIRMLSYFRNTRTSSVVVNGRVVTLMGCILKITGY